MKTIYGFVAMFAVAALIFCGMNIIAKSQTQQSQPTTSSTRSEVQYQPGPSTKAMVTSPKPGPTAKQKAKKGSIGEGNMMMTLQDSNNDYWVEDVDMEGKGKMT